MKRLLSNSFLADELLFGDDEADFFQTGAASTPKKVKFEVKEEFQEGFPLLRLNQALISRIFSFLNFFEWGSLTQINKPK